MPGPLKTPKLLPPLKVPEGLKLTASVYGLICASGWTDETDPYPLYSFHREIEPGVAGRRVASLVGLKAAEDWLSGYQDGWDELRKQNELLKDVRSASARGFLLELPRLVDALQVSGNSSSEVTALCVKAALGTVGFH